MLSGPVYDVRTKLPVGDSSDEGLWDSPDAQFFSTDSIYASYDASLGLFLVGSFTHDDFGNFQYADDAALIRSMLVQRGIPYVEKNGLPYVNEADYRRFYSSLPRRSTFTPFGGPRIWQETLEKIGLPGDPIGSMIESGQGPVLVAAVFTAGIASGAFAGGATVAEGGVLTAEGATLVAEGASVVTESGLVVAEGGALTAEGASLLAEGATISGEVMAAAEETAALAAEFGTEAVLTEAEFAELALEYETALLEAEPVFEAAAVPPISTSPVSAPPPSSGIPLPSLATLAKQAAPIALKALAKPSGPSVPPGQASMSPSAIGFSPYDPRYDRELTGGVDNTMLYTLGAAGLVLAAVVIGSQRKG